MGTFFTATASRRVVTTFAALWVSVSAPLVEAAQPALNSILAQVAANTARRVPSIAISDLDETTIDTLVRMRLAYRVALKELCGAPELTLFRPRSRDCEQALGISQIDMYRRINGYDPTELAQRTGMNPSSFLKVHQRAVDHYLSGKWLDTDASMPGASEYMRQLKRAGAQVYFVSSRFLDTQLTGTIQQLIELGFITRHETQYIVLRPREQDSLQFKRESIERIKQHAARQGAQIVALFENEPENLNAWMQAIPEAKPIFVRGNFMKSAKLDPRATVIESFR